MEKEEIVIESRPVEKNRIWKILILILIILLLLAIMIILSMNVYDYIQAKRNETNITDTNITDIPSNNGSKMNVTYTPKTSVCGDGKCNGTENYTNCARDCRRPPGGGPGDPNPPCTPDCSGKNCGDDGCGESCGTCTNGICNATGRCVAFVNCTADVNCSYHFGACGVGICNTTSKQCYSSFNASSTICRNNVSDCDAIEFCSGGSSSCGNDLNKTDGNICSSGICTNGKCSACKIQCDGKVCGNDGCGGTCTPGCADGQYCSEGSCITGIVYYLNPINGNTTTGDGSYENPWGSLESVVKAKYFNKVKIKEGSILRLMSGYHGYFDGYNSSYMNLAMRNNTEYITIEADSGQHPQLRGMNCVRCSHWKFIGLEFSPSFEPTLLTPHSPPNPPFIVRGNNNDHITFENNYVYTVEDESLWGDYEWTNISWGGFDASKYSSYMTFKNNRIRNVQTGVISTGSYAVFTGNTIDGFTEDGISSLETESRIENNTIINSHQNNFPGWHKDGMQVSKCGIVNNLIIRNNYINSRPDPNRVGNSPASLQGMLLQGSMKNLLVEGNVIISTNSLHGISLDRDSSDCPIADEGVIIINNTLINPYGLGDLSNPPDIYLVNNYNATVKNNIAHYFPRPNSERNITSEGNIDITDYNPEELFLDYMHGDLRPKINSVLCNGSINGKPGVAIGALACF